MKDVTKGAGALRFHLQRGEREMSFQGPLHGAFGALSGRAVDRSVASAVLYVACGMNSSFLVGAFRLAPVSSISSITTMLHARMLFVLRLLISFDSLTNSV